MALPAENAEIQTLTAMRSLPRVLEHREDQRQRRRRERGAGDAEERPAADEHLRRRRERGEHRDGAERRGADQQQLPPADAVTERAHRDEEARDHEAVDVDDPEQLGAARPEVLAHRRHGEVEHRQVHHVEQAGEGEHAQADPFAAAGAGGGGGGCRLGGDHRVVPVSVAFVSVDHCRSWNSSLYIGQSPGARTLSPMARADRLLIGASAGCIQGPAAMESLTRMEGRNPWLQMSEGWSCRWR